MTLTLETFTRYASNVGFGEEDIRFLTGSNDITAPTPLNEQQIITMRKISAVSAFPHPEKDETLWLDHPIHERVSQEFSGKTPRQVIREVPNGLDQYISVLENAAGGPLI